MKTININELIFKENNLIGSGHYGIVKKCIYNGKTYAYKELYEPNEILTPVNIFKFENLKKLPRELINSPEILVHSNNKSTGYLSECLDGSLVGDLFGKNLHIIIKKLKQIKENLEKIHNLGVIHCDIHSSNIIDSTFIDFNNSSYKNIKPNCNQLDWYAQMFISNYGLSKELDIAMFNLLTFRLLFGHKHGQDALKAIYEENYGFLDTEIQHQICNSLLLQDDNPNKTYLIDTIK